MDDKLQITPHVAVCASTPFAIKIKPMLFAYFKFYPNGGWEDFQGFFDSVEDAKKHLESISGFGDDYQYAHIVEDSNITWEACIPFLGKYWQWNKKDES